MPMAPTELCEPAISCRNGPSPSQSPPQPPTAAPGATGPLRIRGRVGDGLYWSLRAAGASPQVAAEYLAALATEIDVGDVARTTASTWCSGRTATALRGARPRRASALQLVRWNANGRSEWIDAANAARPAPVNSGLAMPVNGPITSYFGYRYHPILHFTRFHAGRRHRRELGQPDRRRGRRPGRGAGWGGGYGREVQIAHGGGITSIYGHMSEIVASPGSFVRAGS